MQFHLRAHPACPAPGGAEHPHPFHHRRPLHLPVRDPGAGERPRALSWCQGTATASGGVTGSGDSSGHPQGAQGHRLSPGCIQVFHRATGNGCVQRGLLCPEGMAVSIGNGCIHWKWLCPVGMAVSSGNGQAIWEWLCPSRGDGCVQREWPGHMGMVGFLSCQVSPCPPVEGSQRVLGFGDRMGHTGAAERSGKWGGARACSQPCPEPAHPVGCGIWGVGPCPTPALPPSWTW